MSHYFNESNSNGCSLPHCWIEPGMRFTGLVEFPYEVNHIEIISLTTCQYGFLLPLCQTLNLLIKLEFGEFVKLFLEWSFRNRNTDHWIWGCVWNFFVAIVMFYDTEWYIRKIFKNRAMGGYWYQKSFLVKSRGEF